MSPELGVNHVTGIHRLSFGAPGRIDENSQWAVFTLRAPSASKSLARFIEQQSSSSSGTPKMKKAPVGDPLSFGAPGEIRTPDHLVRS